MSSSSSSSSSLPSSSSSSSSDNTNANNANTSTSRNNGKRIRNLFLFLAWLFGVTLIYQSTTISIVNNSEIDNENETTTSSNNIINMVDAPAVSNIIKRRQKNSKSRNERENIEESQQGQRVDEGDEKIFTKCPEQAFYQRMVDHSTATISKTKSKVKATKITTTTTKLIWRIILSGNNAYEEDFYTWWYYCYKSSLCTGSNDNSSNRYQYSTLLILPSTNEKTATTRASNGTSTKENTVISTRVWNALPHEENHEKNGEQQSSSSSSSSSSSCSNHYQQLIRKLLPDNNDDDEQNFQYIINQILYLSKKQEQEQEQQEQQSRTESNKDHHASTTTSTSTTSWLDEIQFHYIQHMTQIVFYAEDKDIYNKLLPTVVDSSSSSSSTAVAEAASASAAPPLQETTTTTSTIVTNRQQKKQKKLPIKSIISLYSLQKSWLAMDTKFNNARLTGHGRFTYSDKAQFNHMVSRRPSILLQELLALAEENDNEKNKKTDDDEENDDDNIRVQNVILYFDLDTFILQDPRPYLMEYSTIQMYHNKQKQKEQEDKTKTTTNTLSWMTLLGADAQNNDTGPYNTGFLWLLPCIETIQLMRRWKYRLERRVDKGSKPIPNQRVFNEVIRRIDELSPYGQRQQERQQQQQNLNEKDDKGNNGKNKKNKKNKNKNDNNDDNNQNKLIDKGPSVANLTLYHALLPQREFPVGKVLEHLGDGDDHDDDDTTRKEKGQKVRGDDKSITSTTTTTTTKVSLISTSLIPYWSTHVKIFHNNFCEGTSCSKPKRARALGLEWMTSVSYI